MHPAGRRDRRSAAARSTKWSPGGCQIDKAGLDTPFTARFVYLTPTRSPLRLAHTGTVPVSSSSHRHGPRFCPASTRSASGGEVSWVLVRAQPPPDRMTDVALLGPAADGYLGDQVRAHPPRDLALSSGHLGGKRRRLTLPRAQGRAQPLEFGLRETGAHLADIAHPAVTAAVGQAQQQQIGRASCRAREEASRGGLR